MTIDIINTNNAASCREAVNISLQYGSLVKDHNMKIKDRFRERIIYTVISLVVLIALLALTFIFWKVNALTVVAVVLLAVDVILGVVMHLKMKKMLRQLMEDKRKKQLVLDEKGVEVKKDGACVLRIDWNNIAAMRVFDETCCLIAKVFNGPAVIINKAYAAEVKQFIQTQTNVDIEYIGIE